jgi:hypothetical protein
LTEIHSDIRQIKSDNTANAIESTQSGSPEDVLRYLRQTRGEDDTGE